MKNFFIQMILDSKTIEQVDYAEKQASYQLTKEESLKEVRKAAMQKRTELTEETEEEDLENLPMLDDYCRMHGCTWKFSDFSENHILVNGFLFPYEMTLSPKYKDNECMRVKIGGKFYHFG